MTWGTHCPQCGREDCDWTDGHTCQGLQRARRTGWPTTAPRLRDRVAAERRSHVRRRRLGALFLAALSAALVITAIVKSIGRV